MSENTWPHSSTGTETETVTDTETEKGQTAEIAIQGPTTGYP